MESRIEAILEDKNKSILNCLPVGVVIFSKEGQFLYLNAKIKELFGYSRNDIPDLKTWFETAYPVKDYRETVRKDWEAAIQRFFETGEKTEGMEARVRCKDGSYKFIEFGFEAIEDTWVATCVDITNRKIVENELIANREKFKSLFVSAGDSALILQGTKVIDCNPKTLKTLNCTREQIIGLNPWDFSPELQPDGKKSETKAKKMIRRIYKENDIQFIWQHKKMTGEPIDMEINLSLIDRKEEMFFGIMRDITEKKKAEIALKESEERFRSFMDHIPFYALIRDNSLNYIYMNKQIRDFLKNTDKSRSSVIQIADKKTQKLIEKTDRQILSGKIKNKELVYSIIFNNQTIWLKTIRFLIPNPDGTRSVGSAILDITEMKNYQTELEKHKKHLEDLIRERTKELELANRSLGSVNELLNKRKMELEEALSSLKETQSQLIQSEKMASLGILTAGVAHEINNPLNFILGGYSAMEEHLKEIKFDDRKISEILNIIKTGINRTTDIVKSLNQFSRQHESVVEDCDIHSIIDNCLLMLNNQLKHRIEINKHYSTDPVMVIGNVGKLHQVFINILLNATQAIETEGEITIQTVKQNGIVSVNIIDTGCGISEENLSRITDPFFTTKDPGKGTGLGLAITFKLIQDHKGKLEFESGPGKGTKVKVTLPAGKR